MSDEKKRRPGWQWPAVWLTLIVLAASLTRLFDGADFDPYYRGPVAFVAGTCGFVGVTGLLLWFFFASGVGRHWRVSVLVVLLAGVVVLAFSMVGFDVTGNLIPIPRFRWQAGTQEELEKHRAASEPTGLPPIDLSIDPISDFPHYRGLESNGRVQSIELLSNDWGKGSPRVKWKQPCGGGFAGFAVAGNVLVTVEQRREREAVVCYDRATGQERWAHDYPALFRDYTGNGPRATPTIHDGLVYSLGAVGDLVCVDGKTGERRWHVNILEDCRAKVMQWGMASSPLVADGKVIVNAGIDPRNNAGMAVAAYDAKTGKRRWATGSHGAGYSSPMRLTLAGRDQVVLFDAGGLSGLSLEDGSELWRYEWPTFQDMNIAQPLLVRPDRLLISSELSNGCALLRVSRDKEGGFEVEPEWSNRWLGAKYASPVSLNETVIGLSNGTMVCLDAMSGQRLWRGRNYGHGQLLAVDGHVLVLSESGEVALVAADRREFRELGRLPVLTGRTWNTPALTGRHLFVRNDKEMACVELPLR